MKYNIQNLIKPSTRWQQRQSRMIPFSKIPPTYGLSPYVAMTTVKTSVNRENVNLLLFFEPQQIAITMGNFYKTLATSDQLLAFSIFYFIQKCFNCLAALDRVNALVFLDDFYKKMEDIKIYGKIDSLKFEGENPPQQHGAL